MVFELTIIITLTLTSQPQMQNSCGDKNVKTSSAWRS